MYRQEDLLRVEAFHEGSSDGMLLPLDLSMSTAGYADKAAGSISRRHPRCPRRIRKADDEL